MWWCCAREGSGERQEEIKQETRRPGKRRGVDELIQKPENHEIDQEFCGMN